MKRIGRMDADQKRSRFQFTLQGMFLATFWASLSCAAWIADFKWQGSDGLTFADEGLCDDWSLHCHWRTVQ